MATRDRFGRRKHRFDVYSSEYGRSWARTCASRQVLRTLARLREEPYCGRALVCEVNGYPAGYALLISFWSNELGGEVCNIDELFVAPAFRGRGLAANLFTALTSSEPRLWPEKPVALTLEVSPANERAGALYERLGFRGNNLSMRLPLPNQ